MTRVDVERLNRLLTAIAEDSQRRREAIADLGRRVAERDAKALALLAQGYEAVIESLNATRDGDAEPAFMPHVGPLGGPCNFCGTRIDSTSRGRACPSSPQTGGTP